MVSSNLWFTTHRTSLSVESMIVLTSTDSKVECEIRHTGYPKGFPVAQSTSYDIEVPNRIPFDYTEPVNNPANYAKAVALLGGEDNYATPLWWQRK